MSSVWAVDHSFGSHDESVEVEPRWERYNASYEVLYPYQRELLEKCCDKSCLLYLPTGTGKTVVAAVTVAYAHAVYPTKHTIFVVNRLTLVSQQAAVIEKFTTGLRVAQLSGDRKGINSWRDFVENYDVLVVIDVLLIHLCNATSDLFKDVSLVIFDEVPHARKKSPYVTLLGNIAMHNNTVSAQNSNRVQVIGLTATPVSGDSVENSIEQIEYLQQLIQGPFVAVVREREDLNERVQHATSFLVEYSTTATEEEFERILTQFCTEVVDQVLRGVTHSVIAAQMNSLFSMPKMSHFFSTCAREVSKFALSQDMQTLSALLELLARACDALALLTGVSLMAAVEFLCKADNTVRIFLSDDVSDMERRIHTQSQVYVHPFLSHIANLRCRIEQAQHARDANTALGISQPLGNQGDEVLLQDCSRRMLVLSLLRDRISESGGMEKFRCLVFCSTKISATLLVKRLRETELGALANPLVFVGKSRTTAVDGDNITTVKMTEAQQQEALAKFHSGQCKILVATSVAEEGLDVRACNLVISYDSMLTLKTLIQIRGRARAKNSEFIVLADRTTISYFTQLFRTAKTYDKRLEELADRYQDFAIGQGTLFTEFNVTYHIGNFLSKYKTTLDIRVSKGSKGLEVMASVTLPTGATLSAKGVGGRKQANRMAMILLCKELHSMGYVQLGNFSAAGARADLMFQLLDSKSTQLASNEGRNPLGIQKFIREFDPAEWANVNTTPLVLMHTELRRRKIQDPVLKHTTLTDGSTRVDANFSVKDLQGIQCTRECSATHHDRRTAYENAAIAVLEAVGCEITMIHGQFYLGRRK